MKQMKTRYAAFLFDLKTATFDTEYPSYARPSANCELNVTVACSKWKSLYPEQDYGDAKPPRRSSLVAILSVCRGCSGWG